VKKFISIIYHLQQLHTDFLCYEPHLFRSRESKEQGNGGRWVGGTLRRRSFGADRKSPLRGATFEGFRMW
jgi:hypothetical protein